MTKPLYFYNGTTFEQVGPTTPQSPIAYQTSAPTGPATGDLWIDSDGDVDTYNRQLTRYYFVATAAQTTITGTDANGLTLAYVAGSEAVYVNGALQVRGQDYTATNGTSVVLTAGLAVNDVVEIFAYTAFTVANAYTKSETDGVAAAAAGLRMVVPTSVAVGSGSGSVDANGAITFSGASSVSINGCFSSAYQNYRIVTNLTTPSAALSVSWRLRVSGTDAATNYGYASQYAYISINAGGQEVNGGNALTSFPRLVHGSTTGGGSSSADVYRPFEAVETIATGVGMDYDTNTGAVLFQKGWRHTTASSYDGFTLIPSTSTITGTVRVYGYKN
jgi:hypothetical protein